MYMKRWKKRILFVASLFFITTLAYLKFAEVATNHKQYHYENPAIVAKGFTYHSIDDSETKPNPKLKWDFQEAIFKSNNESNILIYNRLPKCASTITRMVIARLQEAHPKRFNLKIDSKPHIKQVLNEDDQKQLVSALSSLHQTTVYIRHMRFLDFTKFQQKRPTYINVIRNPVDQFISAYYFNRFGFVGWTESKIKTWLSPKSDEERFMSLEQCIMENVTECVARNKARYFSYFCGHENECNDDDKWSLEKAKENVANHYSVIGLAEKYEETLWLLENSLPRYFANISILYQNIKETLPVTKTARKVNPSNIARQKLKEALSLRMEFFEFVNERFEQQLAYYKAKLKHLH